MYILTTMLVDGTSRREEYPHTELGKQTIIRIVSDNLNNPNIAYFDLQLSNGGGFAFYECAGYPIFIDNI